MSEKLIELCRHIKNYFPAAFISAGVELRIFRDGREETAIRLNILGDGISVSKEFIDYKSLLRYVQALILSECVGINHKIEEKLMLQRETNFN